MVDELVPVQVPPYYMMRVSLSQDKSPSNCLVDGFHLLLNRWNDFLS